MTKEKTTHFSYFLFLEPYYLIEQSGDFELRPAPEKTTAPAPCMGPMGLPVFSQLTNGRLETAGVQVSIQ
jgi:hypothetical protein